MVRVSGNSGVSESTLQATDWPINKAGYTANKQSFSGEQGHSNFGVTDLPSDLRTYTLLQSRLASDYKYNCMFVETHPCLSELPASF